MIIMGTVLILAPIGADYLFQRNLVALMLKEPSTNATIIPQLSTWYRVVCWLTGSLMVMVGALGAIADSRARFYVAPGDEIEEEEEDEDDEN
jgi:hypothetical protein